MNKKQHIFNKTGNSTTSVTPKTSETLFEYNFPEYGITVMAKDNAEALEKLHEIIDKGKGGEL